MLALLDDHWSRPRKVSKWGVSFRPSGQIGTIRYGGSLTALDEYRGHDSKRVVVRWNPDDLSQVALHDARTMRFICYAQRNILHNAPGKAGKQDYASASRRIKAARQHLNQRIDATALASNIHELAAIEARKREVAETDDRLAAAGIDTKGASANMRLIHTDMDAVERDREQQKLRKAAGAEHDFMPEESGPDIIDQLAGISSGMRAGVDDDEPIDLIGTIAAANGKRDDDHDDAMSFDPMAWHNQADAVVDPDRVRRADASGLDDEGASSLDILGVLGGTSYE